MPLIKYPSQEDDIYSRCGCFFLPTEEKLLKSAESMFKKAPVWPPSSSSGKKAVSYSS